MNRDQLIAAMRGAPSLKKVEVEGWGTLYVRPLTVEQVDMQQQEAREAKDGKDPLRFARAAARMLCDATGQLLFDVNNAEDLKLIAAQPWDKVRAVLEADAGGDEKNG